MQPGVLETRFFGQYQHPHAKARWLTNEAHLRGLKFLQPAQAGFVCVATPLRVSAVWRRYDWQNQVSR